VVCAETLPDVVPSVNQPLSLLFNPNPVCGLSFIYKLELLTSELHFVLIQQLNETQCSNPEVRHTRSYLRGFGQATKFNNKLIKLQHKFVSPELNGELRDRLLRHKVKVVLKNCGPVETSRSADQFGGFILNAWRRGLLSPET